MSGVPRDRCIVAISIRANAVKHTFASEVLNLCECPWAEIETEIWEEEEIWEMSCNGGAIVRWIINFFYLLLELS